MSGMDAPAPSWTLKLGILWCCASQNRRCSRVKAHGELPGEIGQEPPPAFVRSNALCRAALPSGSKPCKKAQDRRQDVYLPKFNPIEAIGLA